MWSNYKKPLANVLSDLVVGQRSALPSVIFGNFRNSVWLVIAWRSYQNRSRNFEKYFTLARSTHTGTERSIIACTVETMWFSAFIHLRYFRKFCGNFRKFPKIFGRSAQSFSLNRYQRHWSSVEDSMWSGFKKTMSTVLEDLGVGQRWFLNPTLVSEISEI